MVLVRMMLLSEVMRDEGGGGYDRVRGDGAGGFRDNEDDEDCDERSFVDGDGWWGGVSGGDGGDSNYNVIEKMHVVKKDGDDF